MRSLKSAVRSVPALHRLARRAKAVIGSEPQGTGFYTASPDLLVALVRAFNIQKLRASVGPDLLKDHGYYEFGLFKGFSFWFAEQLAREYADPTFRLHGFDSFEGLPRPQLDSETASFLKGDFKGSYEAVTSNLSRWKTDFSRIKLHKGFFSKPLFDQLRQNEEFPPISICVIDVDLYQSSVPVLDFVQPYLVVGSIMLFDDFDLAGEDDSKGERRALIEFESRNTRFRKKHLFNYGWEGAAFEVLAI
jgi:Macrocin-O-methyltransferase (TylF)